MAAYISFTFISPIITNGNRFPLPGALPSLLCFILYGLDYLIDGVLPYVTFTSENKIPSMTLQLVSIVNTKTNLVCICKQKTRSVHFKNANTSNSILIHIIY